MTWLPVTLLRRSTGKPRGQSKTTVRIPMLVFLHIVARSLLILVVKVLWSVLYWNLLTMYSGLFSWEFFKVFFNPVVLQILCYQIIHLQEQKCYIWACFFISASHLKFLSKLITKITTWLSQLPGLSCLSSDNGAKAKVKNTRSLWCILARGHGKNSLLIKWQRTCTQGLDMSALTLTKHATKGRRLKFNKGSFPGHPGRGPV